MADTDAPSPTQIGVVSISNGFVTVISFYFPLAFVLFLLFSFLRTRLEEFYAPRALRSRHLHDEHPQRLPQLPRTFFGWLLPTMDYSDAKIYRTNGADVLVYLRFVRMCIVFLAVVGVFAIGVIVPFNYTAAPPATLANFTNYLTCFSMANIPSASSRFYVHLVATVAFSLLLYFLLWRAYRAYFDVRCAYMRKHLVQNYSVMCTEIRLRRGESLDGRFERMFPGQVLAAHRAHVCEELLAACNERRHYQRRLARAREEYQKRGVRPQHREGGWGCGWLSGLCGTAVDSIDYYSERIADAAQRVAALQTSAQVTYTRVGFVTFRSRFPAMVAAQAVVARDLGRWHVDAAPSPADIHWHNLQYSAQERASRTVVVSAVTLVLIVFWAVPVIAIQGVSNLDTLGQLAVFRPLVAFIKSAPTLDGIVSGLLPSLALIAFNAFLPDLIRAFQSLRRFHVHTDLDRACFIVHFAFLVVNTLFVSAIGGVVYQSLLKEAQLVLNEPVQIVLLLGATLPNQATFFMTYILLQGLSTFLVQLLRPKELVVYLALRYWYCKTKEELEEAAAMGPFPYSTRYAQELLVLTITVTYCVMAPPIIIVSLLYFCLAYVVERYNTLFVYRVRHESGGRAFPIAVACVLLALLLFQLVMFGLFTLRGFDPGIVAAALAVLTVAYWVLLHRRFYRASRYLPLDLCLTQDESLPPAWRVAYCQPEMRPEGEQPAAPDDPVDASRHQHAELLVQHESALVSDTDPEDLDAEAGPDGGGPERARLLG